MPFQFCSGSYTLQSPIFDCEVLMDMYCEQPQSPNSKAPISMLKRPGLAVRYQLPEASVPNLFTVNGRSFAAATNFYELLGAFANPNRGALNGAPLSPTQIFSNQTHLLILSNGSLYIYVLTGFTDGFSVFHAAGSFFAVNMAQFNGPVQQIEFIDGYFIATIQNSNTFQVSNLEDGTTWSGLFISTISYFPDNIVSMKVDHRELWFQSNKKSIAYYNSGAGFPPFIPIQGAYLEDGCAAAFATVQVNNTIAWISQDERGVGVAKMMGPYVGERISTLAVEFAWQSYTSISDAIAFSYQYQGHVFWEIRFPSASATWVYDFTAKLWHQESFWNSTSGRYTQHRATSHTFNFQKHLVGDPQSGNIYEMSSNFYTDFGNTIRCMRQCPDFTPENKYGYFSEFEADLETGLGPQPPLLDGNQQPRPPYAVLQWSNDGSKTWSSEFSLPCGQAGDFGKRVRKAMLGRARRRVWRLIMTDPIPWRIVNAYRTAVAEGKAF